MQEEISAVQKLINTLIEFVVNYSFQVVGALIVLVIGLLAGRWTASLILKFFEKKKTDITLARFIAGVVKMSILGFALIIALGKFGITITPFVAALSAAIFGATYAIQGPLSNYGAGLSIILSRPFTVGNTITIGGVSGIVEDVKLACTVLKTEDGVRITMPNKNIVGEILYNSGPSRLAEGAIGISYGTQPEKAIRVVEDVIKKNGDVSKTPRPQIGIQAFADSSVNIAYRYWAPTGRYFEIVFAVNLAVYKAFQEAGISIPFPQREIRILGAVTATP